MDTHFDKIVADAMKLQLKDRVRLAQRLVSSLDEEEMEPDVETLWFAEAERRLEEIRIGRVEGIEDEKAFKDAREALNR